MTLVQPRNTALEHASPTISVLLPIHNAERYLREAIDSVLAQTFDDFELLIIDDGSVDRSLAILQQYERTDGRVRLSSRDNRGLVSTLNELIGKSRGRFLARMDGDDICRPHRFERQVAYLDAHPACVAVGSRALLIDSEGLPICETANESTHAEIETALLSGWGGMRGVCHPTVVMRRDAVLKAGKYRDEYRFAEDLDFFLRLAEVGELAALPQILLEYRQHPTSIGYAHRDDQRNAAVRALTAAQTRRGLTCPGENQISAGALEEPENGHRKWAWWALSAGNLVTARKHARKALARNPFNIENIRVAICALRGH